MFRLVLTYLLVLSLVAGPMLCCCAVARFGHESHAATTSAVTKPARKHCCGESPPAQGGGHKAPGKKPTEPGKCPCKDGGSKVVSAPEASPFTTEALSLLSSALAVGESVSLVSVVVPDRPAPRFDHRSSSLSASDLLYAHHNLRC